MDKKWLLTAGTPGAVCVPFRLDAHKPVGLKEVLFLADCIAYDHDSPTVVQPSAASPIAPRLVIDPVVPSVSEPDALWYYRALHDAYLMAIDVRVGGIVALRYEDEGSLTKFEERFRLVAEAVGLYAMATRQLDALSEFLSLYRVLEWPGKDNGKAYIESHLDRVATYDFGSLEAHAEASSQPAVDVFDTYKHRAVTRLTALRSQGFSNMDVARHLYSIRNGLAHGKSNFLLNDFGPTAASLSGDLPLVKLLARLVIENF